ncbi:60S ribosomal protein L11 [Artemisia annua]|uniref:60S ribosomal protein L11 n=1 Tax=Artemisia annua TaxID=35608 RepID=A0A2U1PWB0_ARTAN|nr:60S ribosomal protein L11 [Artemisia annua]
MYHTPNMGLVSYPRIVVTKPVNCCKNIIIEPCDHRLKYSSWATFFFWPGRCRLIQCLAQSKITPPYTLYDTIKKRLEDSIGGVISIAFSTGGGYSQNRGGGGYEISRRRRGQRAWYWRRAWGDRDGDWSSPNPGVSLSFWNCVYVLVVYENAKRYQAYGLIFISDECFRVFRYPSVRGDKAMQLLESCLKFKESELFRCNFSDNRCFGFGIQDHIDLGINRCYINFICVSPRSDIVYVPVWTSDINFLKPLQAQTSQQSHMMQFYIILQYLHDDQQTEKWRSWMWVNQHLHTPFLRMRLTVVVGISGITHNNGTRLCPSSKYARSKGQSSHRTTKVSTSGCGISKWAVGEIRKRRQTVSVDGLSDTCVPTDGSDIIKQHRIDRYAALAAYFSLQQTLSTLENKFVRCRVQLHTVKLSSKGVTRMVGMALAEALKNQRQGIIGKCMVYYGITHLVRIPSDPPYLTNSPC